MHAVWCLSLCTGWFSPTPQNFNHPYFFPPSFSSFASPLPDTNFSVLITSILFLVCRSSDRHFYQRWFIGYQSIRHYWWVDRNWLVLVTYCSAHAPPFRCLIDDDACLRKVNGENVVHCGWRERIWAKMFQDWNGLCSTSDSWGGELYFLFGKIYVLGHWFVGYLYDCFG